MKILKLITPTILSTFVIGNTAVGKPGALSITCVTNKGEFEEQSQVDMSINVLDSTFRYKIQSQGVSKTGGLKTGCTRLGGSSLTFSSNGNFLNPSIAISGSSHAVCRIDKFDAVSVKLVWSASERSYIIEQFAADSSIRIGSGDLEDNSELRPVEALFGAICTIL